MKIKMDPAVSGAGQSAAMIGYFADNLAEDPGEANSARVDFWQMWLGGR